MVRLRRKLVLAERLNPTRPILDALGPYPADKNLAADWESGADLIHAFRLRYGVTPLNGHPLGQTIGDAQRRRERQVAQRLARLQQQLQYGRLRAAERGLELTL